MDCFINTDNYFDLMRETKNWEVMRYNSSNQSYECLLKNHLNTADYFYNATHGFLTIKIKKEISGSKDYVFLSIASIDDGGIVFFGPTEAYSEATKRLDLLIKKVEEWDGWIPNQEQCIELEKKLGLYWNR